MTTLSNEQLATILKKHAKWLRSETGGESANLRYANLRYADLRSADLSYANLSSADLSYANLRYADLRSADLRYANLRYADLRSADLRYADLSSADLSYADLSSAAGHDLVIARTRTVPPEGPVVGWKQCQSGVLVKIMIPAEAKRSNAFGRKCRAEFVDVLEVVNGEIGISKHDGKTKYEVGQRVECDKWCDDFREECAGGIHFFITREEAEAY